MESQQEQTENQYQEPQFEPQRQKNRRYDGGGLYEYEDAVTEYGSIIKELVETKRILDDYELRLRAKKKDMSGNIVDDPLATPYIKTDRAAREYVNLLR